MIELQILESKVILVAITTKNVIAWSMKHDSKLFHSQSYLGVKGLADCAAPNRFLPTFWRILFSLTLTADDGTVKLLPDISREPGLDEINMLMFCRVLLCEGSRFSEDTVSTFRRWLSDGLVVSMVTVGDPIVICSLFEMKDVILGQEDDLK